mgnify:CR=1 FL=1
MTMKKRDPQKLTPIEKIMIPVAIGLIVIPEPITSAAGTIAGIGLLGGIAARRGITPGGKK